ncbi:MAG: efflux RND transporter periplasmic adaptor subunit [Balneolaceae bacterium]
MKLKQNNAMNKMKQNPTRFFLLLPLIAAGSLFLASCSGETGLPEAEEPVNVELSTVSVSSIGSGQAFSGRVESNDMANLSTIVMGTVQEVLAEVGQNVSKGDVLLRIKDDQIRAQKMQLEANKVQAAANLENTRKNFNRIKNLYADESATSKELDDITAMYEIAKANMEALEAGLREVDEMLSYTVIRAPFDGIVSRKHVKAGDMASPGHPLLSVSNPGSLKITASVPENRVNSIEEDAEITVSVGAAGITNAPARLLNVSRAADPVSRQFAIEAELTDPDLTSNLNPGMFAEIHLKTDETSSVIVPKSALIKRGQLSGVYTVSADNRAVLRWLRLGNEFGDDMEVVAGLKEGETIILTAGEPLKQGRLVSADQ